MSKKKKYQNPLPCGCGVKGVQDIENAYDNGSCLRVGYKDIHVVYCPLHAAAKDLLAALKSLVAETPECDDPKKNPRVGKWCFAHQIKRCKMSAEILPAARAAIAKATGGAA